MKKTKNDLEQGYVYAPYIISPNIEIQDGEGFSGLSRYGLTSKHKDRQNKILKLLNIFKDDEIKELKEKLRNEYGK